MHFTKMEGLGNDYVYVNCFEEKVDDPQQLARLLSDRHHGVGSDGLILIGPSDKADFSMAVYNSDGSIAEMCGNGIRCACKYVYDNHMTESRNISIETLAGIKYLRYLSGGRRQSIVTVDMGAPEIGRNRMTVEAALAERALEEQIEVSGKMISFVRVSMGNPHAVVWLDTLDEACGTGGEKAMSGNQKQSTGEKCDCDTWTGRVDRSIDVMTIGALMEKHDAFPAGTNVEFIRVVDRYHIRMRVWERGSGETMACGTGACAAAAACMAKGYTDDAVTVQLGGGELRIEYDRNKKTINMTGPARTVFDGQVDIFSQEE